MVNFVKKCGRTMTERNVLFVSLTICLLFFVVAPTESKTIYINKRDVADVLEQASSNLVGPTKLFYVLEPNRRTHLHQGVLRALIRRRKSGTNENGDKQADWDSLGWSWGKRR